MSQGKSLDAKHQGFLFATYFSTTERKTIKEEI
jgi:hypothetical protein